MTKTAEEISLAAQLREMKNSLTDLATENAQLRIQRDLARSRLQSFLPAATAEQEEEFRQELSSSECTEMADLLAELQNELS